MRLNLLLICLGLLLLVQSSYAQNKIRGLVTDSLNNPIANATISLKLNNSILKYTKTDNLGSYSLNVDGAVEANLLLEAKSFGYKTATIIYAVERNTYNFTLKEAVINLNAVNVKHKPVIIVKGDTLNYRTADFANENDHSIGDVLKKMPGINVAENGKVTYNNTPITQLYIDGDNILDDKYNIGTKSIPHKTVTKIQVIDHDQPIKMLQKNNQSNDIAINLVIDKTAKLKVIGNAKLGAGLPDRYDETIDLILFKQQFKFLDNISLNNIGTDLSEDVISHNNASNINLAENNRPTFQLSTGVSTTPYLPKGRYLFNNSGIANTNNLFKFNTEKQLKANIYYLYDKRYQNTNYTTQTTLPSETINYGEDQGNKAVNQSIYGQFNYIDNAVTHYVNNGLTIDYSPNNNKALINGLQTPFNQQLNQKRFNLVNDLKYLRTLKSGTILNINSYLEKTYQKELLHITPGINENTLNLGFDYSQLTQRTSIPGLFTNNYITYSTLKNRITQSYQAGFSFQSIDFNSSLAKIQNNHTEETITNAINDIKWNRFKLYLNPGLDYKTEVLHIYVRLPISLNLLNYTPNNNYKQVLTNPSLGLQYQITQENKLTIGYSFAKNMGKIEDIYTGAILKSYRSLVANNIPLPFVKNQRASIGYRYQKAVSMLFASINASYSKTLLDNIIESSITNSIQTRIAVPFANSINNLSVNGSVGKYFIDLHTNLGFEASISRNTGKQLQNNVLFPYKNNSLTFGINNSTKFSKNINWILRSNFTTTQSFINDLENSSLEQLRQYSKIDATIFRKVTMGFAANHIFIHQPKQGNLNYLFTDVNLKYKWTKIKTDFELSINNISNIKSFDSYFIDAISITSASYIIPGRNALLKAIFAFN
ncbi:carboxypeptidase-like regulatory domain-containing protein [Pedobacter frigiditerrae]|uniref:TonB-dependent receptor n=1 Tax=Pedobacter frigiditerrae TaxID=2530452 RepID=UPI00292FE9D3|nr:carboxypeptidase-like regulatory domain-containing protein [Pedobacter frigiditerrae]